MDNAKLKTGAARWGLAAIAVALLAASSMGTCAAEDQRELLRTQFDAALKGKTVAWVPVWLGVLESEWTRVMKAHFDDYGMKFEVRDPNFKSDVQLQAGQFAHQRAPRRARGTEPERHPVSQGAQAGNGRGNIRGAGQHGVQPAQRRLCWR